MRTAAGAPEEARTQRLQTAALGWFDANGRDLAFRGSTEPWHVLVSEVMAQQTQAERAADAWSVFIQRYPTPAALAAASSADVIRSWRGLGYNRRAVALRAAAIRIVEDHGGRVPESIEALEDLPGIGPYTARAVLAIAFGRPVAALDTNIQRVLERSIGDWPASPRACQALADRFVPPGRSASWTHALMDIGATFCRKREPRCAACPLVAGCAFPRNAAAHPAVVDAGSRTGPRRSARTSTPFVLTNRWLRGRILDRLRDAAADAWVPFDRPMGDHDREAVQEALAQLAGEGLLERRPDDPRMARLHA